MGARRGGAWFCDTLDRGGYDLLTLPCPHARRSSSMCCTSSSASGPTSKRAVPLDWSRPFLPVHITPLYPAA